jgi:hypothetical protein
MVSIFQNTQVWQHGDLFYEKAFSYKLSPIEISKEQLIQMAESFK